MSALKQLPGRSSLPNLVCRVMRRIVAIKLLALDFVGPGLKGYDTEHHPAPPQYVSSLLEATMRCGFASFSDSELADLIAYLKML